MRVYYKKTSGKITSLDGTDKKYVLWGDWLDVEEEQPQSDWYVVNWKVWDEAANRVGTAKYRIRKKDCQANALLEMIFLDVGQGDGCIVNVPDGPAQRTLIVDAGDGRNMHAFLKWRFRYVDSNASFDSAIITHPDKDHYRGFQPIFDDSRISFRQVLHNGLVERVGPDDDNLGARANGQCTELYETRAALESFLSDAAVRGSKLYPELLWTALQAPARFGDIAMASTRHGDAHGGRTYLPGFAPTASQLATIEILGPVPEDGPNGPALREFGEVPNDGKFNAGKTKNGHSVILRLDYGGLSVIFGGDLNRPSENYLLRHYGEVDGQAPLKDAVAKARERFGADILKCCHHGSADVTEEFLEAVHPFGIIVSSGDQESHVHPRPEVLGLLGKKGRGDRPVLLCTEILRSTPASTSLSKSEKKEHDRLFGAFAAATDDAARTQARKAIDGFWKRKMRRLVTVYGAINIRTDGQKLIIAFRKEVAKGNPWQIYEYAHVEGEWRGGELGGH